MIAGAERLQNRAQISEKDDFSPRPPIKMLSHSSILGSQISPRSRSEISQEDRGCQYGNSIQPNASLDRDCGRGKPQGYAPSSAKVSKPSATSRRAADNFTELIWEALECQVDGELISWFGGKRRLKYLTVSFLAAMMAMSSSSEAIAGMRMPVPTSLSLHRRCSRPHLRQCDRRRDDVSDHIHEADLFRRSYALWFQASDFCNPYSAGRERETWSARSADIRSNLRSVTASLMTESYNHSLCRTPPMWNSLKNCTKKASGRELFQKDTRNVETPL